MSPAPEITFYGVPDPDEYEATSPQLAQTLRECLASGQEPTVARRTLGGRWIVHVRARFGDHPQPEAPGDPDARGQNNQREAP